MRCVTDLVKLRDSVTSRCSLLRQISSPLSTPLTSEDRRALAYVAIELDNLIVVGLRQYAKSSLLRSRTAAGVRITSSVNPQSTEEAAALIYRSVNPAGYQRANNPQSIRERDEITIRDPKKVEKVLIDYSASNIANMNLALSLNAEVFSEIKVFRHFFAHRAKNTFDAVQIFAAGLGIVDKYRPEHLLVQGRPGTGVKLLDGWFADIENFFDLAT